jgi:hypothetical protein
MTLDELKAQMENEITEIERAKAGLDAALLKKAGALTAVECAIAAAADATGSLDGPEGQSDPEAGSTNEPGTAGGE